MLFFLELPSVMVLILVYMYLKTQYYVKPCGGVLPEIKVPFYSIFGLFRMLPSQSTMKKLSLPKTSYMQQLLSGGAVLFPKEKAVTSRIGLQTLIILKKAESVEEFLRSNPLTTKPFGEFLLPVFGNGVFLSSGNKWRTRRKQLIPLFRYGIIMEFVPVFDEEAKVLVNILMDKHQEPWIDIVEPLSCCAVDIVCRTFLKLNVGVQKEGQSKFVKVKARAAHTMIERMLSPLYHIEAFFAASKLGRQFKQDTTYLRAYALQALKLKREEKKLRKEQSTGTKEIERDFLDLLLDFVANFPGTTDEELRDELLSFSFASQDTMAPALWWSIYLIGLHPEIQRKIHEELDSILGVDHNREITAEDLKKMCYLDRVLKECQRLYPSVPINPKYMLEDCTLFDCKIRKGSIVIIDAYDLHRDPDVFSNPEVFDPDRFLPENCAGWSRYTYIPFSKGARSCLGKQFATMAVTTVVANILHMFSLKSLEPRDKVHTAPEITLRSTKPLKVKFILRHTSDVTKSTIRM